MTSRPPVEAAVWNDLAMKVADVAVDVPEPAMLAGEATAGVDSAGSTSLPSGLARTHVLLTGATGFIGGEVLAQLATLEAAHMPHAITCLVRAETDGAATERLRRVLADRCSEAAAASVGSGDGAAAAGAYSSPQIVALRGDLSSSSLGLTAERYEVLLKSLSGGAGVIVHAGARMNWRDSYATMRGANVDGTVEVMRLATRARVRAVHYVSTRSVAPHSSTGGSSTDEDSDLDPVGLRSMGGYARSKFVAEVLARRIASAAQVAAKGSGDVAPALRVYRPGMVTWHSTTGYCNPQDFATRCVRGFVARGCFPQSDVAFEAVPVDLCARVLVHAACTAPGARSIECYTISNAASPSFTRLGELLRRVTASDAAMPASLRGLEYGTWRDDLERDFTSTIGAGSASGAGGDGARAGRTDDGAAAREALFALLPWFPRGSPPRPAFGDTSAAEAVMADGGFRVPTIDEECVRAVVSHLRQRGLLPDSTPSLT